MISVIVPVFNLAPYVPECLNSLIAQTYKDVEIIVVDDGSADWSGQLCDSYAIYSCGTDCETDCWGGYHPCGEEECEYDDIRSSVYTP